MRGARDRHATVQCIVLLVEYGALLFRFESPSTLFTITVFVSSGFELDSVSFAFLQLDSGFGT